MMSSAEDLMFYVFIAIIVVATVLYAIGRKVRGSIDLHRAGDEPTQAKWPIHRPLWVRAGLLHVGSRQTAINFARLSVLEAVVFALIAAYVAPERPLFFLPSAMLLLAAGWYWLCIKWADRNEAWP